jgi:hypothetical protein
MYLLRFKRINEGEAFPLELVSTTALFLLPIHFNRFKRIVPPLTSLFLSPLLNIRLNLFTPILLALNRLAPRSPVRYLCNKVRIGI